MIYHHGRVPHQKLGMVSYTFGYDWVTLGASKQRKSNIRNAHLFENLGGLEIRN